MGVGPPSVWAGPPSSRSEGRREGSAWPRRGPQPGHAAVTWHHVVLLLPCRPNLLSSPGAGERRRRVPPLHLHAASRCGAPPHPVSALWARAARSAAAIRREDPRTTQRPLAEAEAENPRYVRLLGLPYT